MREKGASLYHIILVELDGRWVLVELEAARDVAIVVVLELENTGHHLGNVLRVHLGATLGAHLAAGRSETALLNYARRIIEGSRGHIAPLVLAGNVQQKAVGRKLLLSLYLYDISRPDFGPDSGDVFFELSRDIE